VVNPRKFALLLLLVASLVLGAACNTSQTKITNTPIPVLNGQPGLFDVMEIDQAHHRLYVADRTDHGIDVFDVSTARARFIETFPLSGTPNGLAIAPDLGRLYVGMVTGSVAILDLVNQPLGTVIKEVPTGGLQVDLLEYAATSKVLFAGLPAEKTVTTIDAVTGVVKAQLKVGFVPEQPRFNPNDGMLYLTSPDAGAILKIDPSTGTVLDKITLAGCSPKGLAINPRTDKALIACTDSVASWDFRTRTSTSFGEVFGGDIVTYDAKVDRFFVAVPGSQGNAGEVAIFGGNPIDYLSSVSTPATGNSAAYDETNDVVYALDARQHSAGLSGFRKPADDQLPQGFVTSLGVFGAVVAVAIAAIWMIARLGGPRPKSEAELARPVARPKRTTWRRRDARPS
jgi:DNA-binding beta-propeller fold protein YncE